MKATVPFPFYARVSLICVGLFVFVWILSVTKEIVVPLLFATIIAVVLNPIVDFLIRKKWNRVLAIAVVLFVVACIAASVALLLGNQLMQFGRSLPVMIDNFNLLADDVMMWFSDKFDISIREIHSWTEDRSGEIADGASSKVGTTLMTTGGVLIVLVLIPVYVFLILLYQSMLIEFIHRIFYSAKKRDINTIISKTKVIIQSYLVGLLLEAAIMAVLYSSALLILGVQYAILLGVIGAFFNMIPYLGALISVLLPMVVSLASQSPYTALLVLGTFFVIQLVDNNYILPRIVASRVRINALASIVAVIAGGMLWGVPGMFLSIPMVAILKVIFDHIEEMKPLGFLLGTSESEPGIRFLKQKVTQKKDEDLKKEIAASKQKT